jgi:lipopolysaccharide transport system permease protein
VVFGRIADLNSDRVPYPLFAMTGWLPWMYLSSAVALVTLSLVTDQSLLTKANFPRLLIPLTKAVRPLIDLVLGLGLMVPMMLWYEVAPTWRVAALPLCALYALVVALGVGLWLAPLNCRFRDVGNAVPFLVQVWMFSSPILYPATLVPVEGHFLYALNPAVGVIETFRWAVLGSADLDVELLVVSSGVAAAVLLIGLLVFARAERRLVDIL